MAIQLISPVGFPKQNFYYFRYYELIRVHIGFPYSLFFLSAIFLNYLPDLSPYYLSLFSKNQFRVIGPLTRFAQPCPDVAVDDWACRVQYRIPRGIIGNAETIGFGVILFSTEVLCDNSPAQRVVLNPREEDGGKVSDYLKTYQILSLDRLQCDGDLLVKNWSKRTFGRFGYSQGQVSVGNQKWIELVKKLVEFSIVGLSAASAFIFFIFYLILKALQRITQTSITYPPFDPFRFFWLGFVCLATGYLFEFVLPVSFSFPFVAKLTNFFGLMALSGPTLLFIATNGPAFPVLGKVASFLVASPRYRLWPLIVLVAVAILSPKFSYIYPYAFVILGSICIITALRVRNLEVLFYGICALLDGSKILMVAGLPASRMTMTYMLFIFVYGMRRQIAALEQNARFEAGSAVAHQFAHDIRSPVGALKSVVPLLSGSEEIREVALAALKRIQSVADDLLRSSRAVTTQSGLVTREELMELTKDVVAQKRYELQKNDIEIIEVYINNPIHVCLNPAMYGRILSNILNNAVDALPPFGGKIKVAISVSEAMATISVSDNGSGIPANILESIGRKGFSTKTDVSRFGSGIGLFNAKKVLDQWNAQLKITSLEKRYTEVTITFPLAKDSVG